MEIPLPIENEKIVPGENLLNDLDRLPKQTTKTKTEGYKGETRSINIPANNNKLPSHCKH